MGLMLESSVLIAAERKKFDLLGFLAAHSGESLTTAAITVSELRHGCLRAVDPAVRARRELFVADVLSRLTIIPFGPDEAERHASLWVDLELSGQMIGPHDLLIAATACVSQDMLATLNHSEFSRVPGLPLAPTSRWHVAT
jgi:tRNA(fMet)-specific endonuclease VapC